MSEKAPKNPEEAWENKRFRDNCMNCDINFGLNKDNTYAVVYEKDPDYNHLGVCCPDCNHYYIVFCDSATLDMAREAGCVFNPKVRKLDMETDEETVERAGGIYAPEGIVDGYMAIQGVEMVQPVEISPRHEQQIAAFGATITAMTEQDPDGFWADMGSEATGDRPYNNKWC